VNKFSKIQFAMAAMIVAATIAPAAALTEATSTPYRPGIAGGFIQASNVVYGGAIAAIDTTTGKIVPATDSTNLMVVGCIRQTSDNGGISSANYSVTRKISAQRGVFRWDNGDSYTAADVGQVCYIEDDHTVQKAASATQDIPVGVIVEVDSDGVWVDVTALSKILAGSLGTLTVSGNGTVGGTLDVTGVTTLGGAVGVTGALTGSSTLSATGYKIGATAGYSGIVTNISTLSTNVIYYSGGIITNVVRNP